eukprot:1900508-Rhodomonas_salina.1
MTIRKVMLCQPPCETPPYQYGLSGFNAGPASGCKSVTTGLCLPPYLSRISSINPAIQTCRLNRCSTSGFLMCQRCRALIAATSIKK